MKILKVLSAAACLSLAVISTAKAVPVTVDGEAYDITVIPGTTSNLDQILKDQIWYPENWRDHSLALKFAEALKFDGGYQGIEPYFSGPIFVWHITPAYYMPDSDDMEYNFSYYRSSSPTGEGGYVESSLTVGSDWWNFAIITPSTTAVPIPAGGLMMISAIAGVFAIRRQKKDSS